MYERFCTECGQGFWATRKDAHYCSARCRQRASRRRSKLYRALGVTGHVRSIRINGQQHVMTEDAR